jgi:hypothetical protein
VRVAIETFDIRYLNIYHIRCSAGAGNGRRAAALWKKSDTLLRRLRASGLAVNSWSGTDEIAQLRGPGTLFEPKAARVGMKVRQSKWRVTVWRSAGWNDPANGVGYLAKPEDPLKQ